MAFDNCILSFPKYAIHLGVFGDVPLNQQLAEYVLKGEFYPPKDSTLREIWRRTRSYHEGKETRGLNGLYHISFPYERIIPSVEALLGYGWQFNDSSGNILAYSVDDFISYAENTGRIRVSAYIVRVAPLSERSEVRAQEIAVTYNTSKSFTYKEAFQVGDFYNLYVDEGSERYHTKLSRHNDEDLPEPESEEDPISWFNVPKRALMPLIGRMADRALAESKPTQGWISYKSRKIDVTYSQAPETIYRIYEYELKSKQRFPSYELVDHSSPYGTYNHQLPVELSTGLMLAWSDATSKIPVMSNNMFQNVLGLRDNLADFAFGSAESMVKTASKTTRKTGSRKLKAIRKKLKQSKMTQALHTLFPEYAKNLWLRGRYEWATNWSDVESSWNVIYDMMQSEINPFYEQPVAYGSYTDDDGVTYRCSFRYKERVNDSLDDYFAHLYKYGFQVNPEVIWDFIPYSFVVDWFLPVGDWLAANDRAYNYGTQYYEFKDGFCFSTKYRINFTYGGEAIAYTRWYASEPPDWDVGAYAANNLHDAVSQKTTAFRMLDSVYLITNFL